MASRFNILKLEKQTGAKPCFEMGEHKIQMISDTKLLGVAIDDKFRWGYQMKQIKVKALQALVLIKHAKTFLPSSDLQNV